MAVDLTDGADAADTEELMLNQAESLVNVTHVLKAWKVCTEDLRVGKVSQLRKMGIQSRDHVVKVIQSTSLKLSKL